MEDKTTDKLMSRLTQWQSAVGQSWSDTPADEQEKSAAVPEPPSAPLPEVVVAAVPVEPVISAPQASPREAWSPETRAAAKPVATVTVEPAAEPVMNTRPFEPPKPLHFEAVARDRTGELFGERGRHNGHTKPKPQRKTTRFAMTSERRRDLMAAIWMCAAILVLVLTILLTTSHRG